MPKLLIIAHDGKEYRIEAEEGQSVMQAAVNASIPGILADCGGNCSCATCHGYVDPLWWDRLPPPGGDERDLLEGAIDPLPNSRLTCQLHMGHEIDGLVIRLPKSQV